jgi:enoyl-CoA hydratase/carnithine racemase
MSGPRSSASQEERFGDSITVRTLHARITEPVLARQACNAITVDTARSLVAATAWLATERPRHVVVSTSADARAFCAGANLKERATVDHRGRLDVRPLTRAAHTSVRAALSADRAEGFAASTGKRATRWPSYA